MRPEAGEQVRYCGHPCWRAMLGFHVRNLVLAILAGAATGIANRTAAGHIQAGWVTLGVLVVLGVGLLISLARRRATTYTVTDRRIVVEHGWLRRDVHQARLTYVLNVAVSQSLRQRLLQIGNVHFDTGAGADYEFSFWGIEYPRDLVGEVERVQRESAPPRWEWERPGAERLGSRG